ncbi:hypothetical protein Taro_038249 [Colocasia esculenta]|uniref:Uncharacterized protein n=1 Tax=Colocasia esculenta TaxID=4460 RepID=A0A843WDC9_COLES|nr:hypothetical protein [Colocasia esculenta]
MVLLCCPAYSPGAQHLRTCPRSERLLPLPGTPILGSLLREYSGLQVCSSRQPTERTLELRGKRKVRRGAAAWPGCGVACVVCFCGGSVSPFTRVEVGARLASRACGLRVPLLAASGGGLVAVVVTSGLDRCAEGYFCFVPDSVGFHGSRVCVARPRVAVMAFLCSAA